MSSTLKRASEMRHVLMTICAEENDGSLKDFFGVCEFWEGVSKVFLRSSTWSKKGRCSRNYIMLAKFV